MISGIGRDFYCMLKVIGIPFLDRKIPETITAEHTNLHNFVATKKIAMLRKYQLHEKQYVAVIRIITYLIIKL